MENFTSIFPAGPSTYLLNIYIYIYIDIITKSPDLVFENLGSGVHPFWDLKIESADILKIVFIGVGPATMVILYVGVMPGDARQEA